MRKRGGEALYFLPLGGAGEIGMNLNLYRYAGKWLMVDLGVTFGDDSTPGVEVITPDPSFIEEHRDDLLGLVLTHAHEDHLGAVPYLWRRLRCPVWATGFAASMLRRKLEEVGLAGEVPITVVGPSGRVQIGPFDVEYISITHSIPESNALAIRTPAGTVLHTGDWKFDPEPLVGEATDEAAFKRFGDENILALVGDSTNALQPGHSGSEADVRRALVELFGRFSQRVAVACFASNVARLETVAVAAAAHGRDVALVGRSLWRINEAARENGYLKDVRPFLDEVDAGYMPRERIVLLCTGSQGESRAALARIAADEHPHVVLEGGDVAIFSSRVIPGNERAIRRLQNRLAAMGVELVTAEESGPLDLAPDHPTETVPGPIHVSGHPCRDELTRMYQLVRPRIAIPVHGETRHMEAHAVLARACQVPHALIPANGQLIRLDPDGPEVVEQVQAGRLALDGQELIPLGGALMRSRTRMLWNGAIVATVALDRRGRLMTPPQIAAPGLIDPAAEGDGLARALVAAIEQAIRALPGKADDARVKEAARRAIRRTVALLRGKKPATDVHLVRI